MESKLIHGQGQDKYSNSFLFNSEAHNTVHLSWKNEEEETKRIIIIIIIVDLMTLSYMYLYNNCIKLIFTNNVSECQSPIDTCMYMYEYTSQY